MANMLRRRTYLIDRRLQLRFTVLVVALVVVYSLFLGAATYMNYKISCIVFDNTTLYEPAVEKAIEAGGRKMMMTTIAFLVINGIVVGVVFVLLTHKVAGPLYRIRRHIAQIQSGRLPERMILRKGDELRHVAQGINEMTESLRAAAEQDVKELTGVVGMLQSARNDLQQGGQPASVAARIDEALRRLSAVSAGRQKLLGA